MEPIDGGPLLVEDRGSIRHITFNRPDVHNAQDPEMLRLLDRALADVAVSPSVRVLVIGGSGRSFCSGHDLRQIGDNPTYRERASTAEGRYWQEHELFAGPVNRLRELPIPVVSRVQGYCLAAGLMFVAVSDFVVASTDAQFGSPILSTMAVNDAETASFMLRVREDVAKRVIWLGERITAEEARMAGLVTWVVPEESLDQKVDDVARRLANQPRVGLELSKQSFQFMADRRGERDVNRFHYMAHQFSHQTKEATDLLRERQRRLDSGGPESSNSQRDV
jgi:enoyl-CoA hydratase